MPYGEEEGRRGFRSLADFEHPLPSSRRNQHLPLVPQRGGATRGVCPAASGWAFRILSCSSHDSQVGIGAKFAKSGCTACEIALVASRRGTHGGVGKDAMQLEERVARVGLLLASLDDAYPRPQGALKTDPGPSPSRYVPCETCRQRGEVRAAGGWKACLVCDGSGWKRRTDEQPYDAYIGLPIEVALELPTELPRVVPEVVAVETYGWERARARQDQLGSYAELRRQLDWLSIVNPRRCHLVLVRRDHPEAQLGVVAIALRMRRVKVPYWLLERDESHRRNDTIDDLAAAGMRAGEIARRLGMTKAAVRRKLKRKAVGSEPAGIPARAM